MINTEYFHEKTYEFQVYIFASAYMNEIELLTNITKKFRGCLGETAQEKAEEFARDIGMFGLSLEDPKNHYAFFPASRIAKVEFLEIPDAQETATIK